MIYQSSASPAIPQVSEAYCTALLSLSHIIDENSWSAPMCRRQTSAYYSCITRLTIVFQFYRVTLVERRSLLGGGRLGFTGCTMCFVAVGVYVVISLDRALTEITFD